MDIDQSFLGPHILTSAVKRVDTAVFDAIKLVVDGKLQVLTLGRSQHFDPLVSRHQHFICEACEQVYDILLDSDERLLPKLPHEGFTVTSHQMAFYGRCKQCAE